MATKRALITRKRPKTEKKKPSEAIYTTSHIPVKLLYTPDDVADLNYGAELNDPGLYPYTRGTYPTMYRGKLWTMRMFSGYGTPEETNQRFKYLIKNGETGLSVAFDHPTLRGLDADDQRAHGEVGRGGVNISSIRDMETLFDGIRMDEITTSMTINAPTIAILSMYLAVAEEKGCSLEKISGTTQNDMLKEFMSEKTYVLPPEPSLNLVADVIKFCTKYVPRWHPVSISGYHIREAGATAVQELAFTIANGITYVEKCLEIGLKVDEFAPRLSFFFNAHNNLFEEIAKYRAARRIWAKIMRERFEAKDPRSWQMRFHIQTSGVSLQAQQAELNIIRVAYQALAAVLGGCQSLHTDSYDEALSLPTDQAVKIAVRTQQILAYETGVSDVIDPLGGSYYLEELTREVEERAQDYLRRIEKMGGVLKGLENDFFLKEIANSSYEYQKRVEMGDLKIVGVNSYQIKNEKIPYGILRVPLSTEKRQSKQLHSLRSKRDSADARRLLTQLKKRAQDNEFLMPTVLKAVKAHCTVGEIFNVFRELYGEYEEQAIT